MDRTTFDALVRSFAVTDTRRALLRLLLGVSFLAALTALLGSPPDTWAKNGHGGSHRRRRRKTRHKHDRNRVRRNKPHKHRKKRKKPQPQTQAQCVPDAIEMTCAGQCGDVANNCGTRVACPPCPCAPPCGPCQSCNVDTVSCDPLPDGTACDDGDACTLKDTCQNGACQAGTAKVCTALDQCHDVGTCDPGTGVCSNPNKDNGTSCDDGNACTLNDTCQGGICQGGAAVVCTAQDECYDVGACDPGTGVCSNPTKENGTVCNDGDACTQIDTCQAGVCQGGNPVVCTVPNACQTSTCDPGSGLCSAPVALPNRTPCGDGDICCDGACCDGCCSTDEPSGGTCGVCRVFLSSSIHTGNLGGLGGADDICQSRADAVPLPGTYKAWLSIGNGPDQSPASGRFRRSAQLYQRVDGTPLAANWATLTDGGLDEVIGVTETGQVVSDQRAWTNTLPDGTAGGQRPNGHCQQWTNDTASGSNLGNLGSTNFADGRWSNDAGVLCSQAQFNGIGRHLYCFQQD